jgi:hypothetical protein
MNTHTRTPATLVVALLAVVLAVPMLATPLAAQGLAPVDRGWYGADGTHSGYGYIVGNCPNCAAITYRNWFVFDLGCFTEPITSASLVLEMPDNSSFSSGGFFSQDPFETYALFDVTTSLEDLMAGVGGVAAYDDLGNGSFFGSVDVQEAHEGGDVVVSLNAAGLAALNAALGGQVGIGGMIETLDGDPGTGERAFRYSGDWAVRLVIEPSCDVRDAVDRGWYREDGHHNPTNPNYLVGNWTTEFEYHNFFVFDMAGGGGLITGATLALEHPYAFGTSDPFETYTLFEVSSPLADLVLGTGGLTAFDDLADGTEYGSYAMTSADGYSNVTIPLDTAGLAALNEAGGGLMALGGAITTLDADPTTVEGGFGTADPVHCISQLILERAQQWQYLGGGTPGGNGVPYLTATGSLEPGSPMTMDLTGAPAFATMLVWISNTSAPLSVFGGTLHAYPPNAEFVLPADAAGEFHVAANWPTGIPAGTQLWFQFLIGDAAALPWQISMTNGLLATTP